MIIPVDPFLLFVDGVPFFGADRLFDGSGRTFVGFFLFGLLDDWFVNEHTRDEGDSLDEEDEDRARGRGTDFDIEYRAGDNRRGTSSFDVFGR